MTFAANLALGAIVQHSVQCELGPGILDEGAQLLSSASMTGGINSEVEPPQLVANPVLEWSVVNSRGEAAISGKVTFAMIYSIIDGELPDPTEVNAFAMSSIAFQIHPYFRQHVADMCQRSGLPGYLLPMLVMNPGDQEQPAAD